MRITVLRSGSKGNCYHLAGSGGLPMLLDAGLPLREIRERLNFSLSHLAGCLVTHEHGDHAKAVKDLVKAGVDVYLSEGTAKPLAIEHHRLHTVKARAWFSVGDWLVMAFPVVHDAEEPFGFLVCREDARLLYLTDTAYSPFRFKTLTHIMIECNYALDILQKNVAAGLVPSAVKDRVLRSHFSLENVKKFLLANDLSKVQEIWLLHLSDGNSDAERFKREIQQITGKVVTIA